MDRRELTTAVVVTGLLVGGALALKFAERSGLIDAATTERLFEIAMGLTVAFYGNFIPKQLGRSRGIEADRRKQSALRVSGWAFTLAGLAYAGLSALAPQAWAVDAAMAVMATAVAVSLLYGLRCYASGRLGGSAG